MASYYPKLMDKKYNNWVKAQLAVFFTKEGVEPFVCNEIKQFQLKCLHGICYLNELPSGTCCSICYTENLVQCPTNKICNRSRGKCTYHRNVTTQYNSSGCPNKICHNLKTEIQNAHRYNGPSYKNSDATQWCSNFWEVAKCFMPPDGYKDRSSATETDFNGIISVILNHKDFQGKVHENLNKRSNIFEEVREIGRKVRHSSTLEVEDSDLHHYFQLLQQMLSDPGYLRTDTHAQNAKKKLIQLEDDTLVIGKDEISEIRKLLDDVTTGIKDKMKAGLDEHYNRIKLDIIKRKKEDLLSLESNTAERMTQIQDKTDHSVKRLHDERDKAIDTLRKQGDKEQTDLAELGKTLQEKLKTASKAEKEKQYIDSLQKKPFILNTRRKKQSTQRPVVEINHLSIGTFVFNHTSHKMEQNVPKPEKAKLFESYYSEFSAKEEECHQFASTWGFNAKSPRGNFIDTRDCSPITESVFESKVKVEASSSVCMICFPGGGTATGFRVGARYIMTANHVVDHILGSKDFGQKGNTQTCFSALNSAEVYARFEFIKDGPITEHQIFRFKAVVHFRDNETDCAILELEEKCNGTEIPRSFKYFSLPRLNQRFNLIGHPLGNAMEFNHVDKIIDIESEETKRDIIEVKQRSLKRSGKDYDMPPHNILNNPKRFLFHCKFTKGASGSPGVVTCKDGRIVVVTMLLCGLPDWYYDSNVDANVRYQWPKDHCVEQGLNLKYVYEKMYQEDESLCNQIFHDHDDSKSN